MKLKILNKELTYQNLILTEMDISIHVVKGCRCFHKGINSDVKFSLISCQNFNTFRVKFYVAPSVLKIAIEVVFFC